MINSYLIRIGCTVILEYMLPSIGSDGKYHTASSRLAMQGIPACLYILAPGSCLLAYY